MWVRTDLKTCHLLKASPRAQFFGQLIGSFASIFFSVAAYLLYTHAYQVPGTTRFPPLDTTHTHTATNVARAGPKFPVPTAGVWVNMARMVNGEVEAHNVFPFCLVAGLLAGLLAGEGPADAARRGAALAARAVTVVGGRPAAS